ncbi:DUF3604 domain-containing protein [bacterium]|nr:DUF3604 domain-containing protein [bacterium]
MKHQKYFQHPVRIPENIQVEIAEPNVAKAGEKRTWLLKFTLSEAIPEAQRIHLFIYGGRNNKGVWENIQIDEPSKEGYVSLRTASGRQLQPLDINNGMIAFAAPNGGLKKGEKLVAELNGQAPRLSLPNKFFLLLKAAPEDNLSAPTLFGDVLQNIIGACLIHIVGNDVTNLRAYSKSQAVAGEELSILVRPEDEYGNVASEELGNLVVRVNDQEINAKRESVKNSTCCILKGIILLEEGIYRLEIEDTSNGLKTLTNPIRCCSDAPSYGILWGVIHGHTEMSDGAGTLNHYFTYMRDECGLDFGALSDHDHLFETSDEMWQQTQEATAKYNNPGKFTTFLGYEWAKWRKNGDGDRNVYYLHDKRPMFRSDDGEYPTPEALFKALESETAITIPHHPADVGNHCDWKDHEPEKERLVEIYSCWGNSERSVHDGNPFPVRPSGVESNAIDAGEVPSGFVQRALALGWRVGFTAGGDDHVAHAGDEILIGGKPWLYKAGLMAVYATENTREAIWDAMWNRRVYATTGPRIILNLQLNGHLMGSELCLSAHPDLSSKRKLTVAVRGTDTIKSIEIVRNNKDIYTHCADTPDIVFDWEDTDPLANVNLPPALHCPVPFTFYYIRVTQADGEMAWSSPIWILS